MKRQKQLITAILWLLASHTAAQVVIYNSGVPLTLSAGATATVQGSYVNQTSGSPGSIHNAGSWQVSGHWTNNAGNAVFSSNEGTIVFNGTGEQLVGGTAPTHFYDLTIAKASGDLRLTAGQHRVNNILTLGQGDIILDGFDLILGTAATVAATPGPSAAGYIQADKKGMLIKHLAGPGTFTFPIGDDDEYAPFRVSLNNATFIGTGYLAANVTDATDPAILCQEPISRYWTLSSGGIQTIDYDVLYQYTAADLAGSDANLFAVRYEPSSGCVPFEKANTAARTLQSIQGIREIPQNHRFTGASISVLPIELISFEGAYLKGQVCLTWSTASEFNNDFFTVGRSADGQYFTKLADLKGAGFSTQPLTYSLTDFHPTVGLNYYRLSQTDFDGQFIYHDVIVVENPEETLQLEMRYAPYNNSIVMDYTGHFEEATLEVFTLRGVRIFHENLAGYIREVPLFERPPTSIYIARFTTRTEQFTTKLMIQ